jgi:hypothetical protein
MPPESSTWPCRFSRKRSSEARPGSALTIPTALSRRPGRGRRVHVRVVLVGRSVRGRGDRLRLGPRALHALNSRRQDKTDKIDAGKIPSLLRCGLFPQAYAYPKALRKTRDLLRRRTFLVHHPASTHARSNIRCPTTRKNSRITGPCRRCEGHSSKWSFCLFERGSTSCRGPRRCSARSPNLRKPSATNLIPIFSLRPGSGEARAVFTFLWRSVKVCGRMTVW